MNAKPRSTAALDGMIGRPLAADVFLVVGLFLATYALWVRYLALDVHFDFEVFFVAASALDMGGELYGAVDGYRSGPGLALVLSPLVGLGLARAGMIWFWVTLVVLLLGVHVLRRELGGWNRNGAFPTLLVLLVSMPLEHTLILGQVSLIALIAGLISWRWRADPVRWRRLVAALGLWFVIETKPHFAWLLVLLLLVQRRLGVLLAAGAIVVLENLWLLWTNPSATWVQWLRSLAPVAGDLTSEQRRSIVGRAAARFLGLPEGWVLPLTAIAAVVALAVVVWLSRRQRIRDDGKLHLALWLVVVPLCSPYVHPQDWLPAIFALLLLLGRAGSMRLELGLVAALALWVVSSGVSLMTEVSLVQSLRLLLAAGAVGLIAKRPASAAVCVLLVGGAVMLIGEGFAEQLYMQPLAAVWGVVSVLAITAHAVPRVSSAYVRGGNSSATK